MNSGGLAFFEGVHFCRKVFGLRCLLVQLLPGFVLNGLEFQELFLEDRDPFLQRIDGRGWRDR